MILLDTNVIVDALDKSQPHHAWAKKQIEDAVVAEGGGISVVTLAELCAGARDPEEVEPEVKRLGITVHDVPAVVRSFAARLIAAMSQRGAAPAAVRPPKCRCRTSSSARRRKSWAGSLPRATRSGSKDISRRWRW